MSLSDSYGNGEVKLALMIFCGKGGWRVSVVVVINPIAKCRRERKKILLIPSTKYYTELLTAKPKYLHGLERSGKVDRTLSIGMHLER